MKKMTLLCLFFITCGVYAQSQNQSVLQKSLKPWKPVSITESSRVITIALDENSVTSEIYELVVESGICAPLWSGSQKSGYLSGVKEVQVLNKHSFAGFVFENPGSSCKEVGEAKGDSGKIAIASHTHIH